jgi:hypothetical protein
LNRILAVAVVLQLHILKQWARDECYGIVTKRTSYDNQKPPEPRKRASVNNTCDKYGVSRQKPFSIRNTSARKMDANLSSLSLESR